MPSGGSVEGRAVEGQAEAREETRTELGVMVITILIRM